MSVATATERHAARWARRRALVLDRRFRLSMPATETPRTSVRLKVMTADGPVYVRVSEEIAAVYRKRDASLLGHHVDGVTVSAWSLWENARSLDGESRLYVEAPAPDGIGAIMTERPLGLQREPSWSVGAFTLKGVGDRRNGQMWTDALRLAWWQNMAGVAATAVRTRRAPVRKVTGRTRSGAAKADAATLAQSRRLASFARQRAALTAAAIASGQLTND